MSLFRNRRGIASQAMQAMANYRQDQKTKKRKKRGGGLLLYRRGGSWVGLFWTEIHWRPMRVQYFGHLMGRTDSLEKTPMLGKMKAGGEGNDRGWDGWTAAPTQWTWVGANSGRWWRTGKPGMLQPWGRRVGQSWATEQQQMRVQGGNSFSLTKSVVVSHWRGCLLGNSLLLGM